MPTPRWEYLVLDVGVAGFWIGPKLDGDAFTAKLNELGAQGWEAVSIAGISFAQGGTRDLVVVLKHPLT